MLTAVLAVCLWLSLSSAVCLCEVTHELHLSSLRLEVSNSLHVLVNTRLCEVELLMSSIDFSLKVYKLMLEVCHACPFLGFFAKQLLNLQVTVRQ